MEIFQGKSGKLQVANGGSWLLFSADTEDFNWTGSSCALPTIHQDDHKHIKTLRDWVRREQPCDQAAATNEQTDNTIAVSPVNTFDVTVTPLTLMALDSYACVCAQVLRRAILCTPNQANNKLAILTIWDGSKRRLEYNQPLLDDFTVDALDGSMLDRLLPDYCYHLVLYGEHVKRARQLKLGALYKFYGVHCKVYPRVGKPELYLHERNSVLAQTVTSADDKARLVERMQQAVDELGTVALDISKSNHTM